MQSSTASLGFGVAPAAEQSIPTATLLRLKKGTKIYAQNDAGDAIYRVQRGVVGFTVVSDRGKEALLGLLGPGSFFGDHRLAGMRRRVGTATALTDCAVVRIDRGAFLRHLAEDRLAMENYLAHLMERNAEFEADLCGHLFDTSEERLLRLLAKLGALGTRNGETIEVPLRLTHEMIAQMIGTTRSRVTYFMNRFRRLGLVEYGRTFVIHVPALMAKVAGLPRLPFTTREPGVETSADAAR